MSDVLRSYLTVAIFTATAVVLAGSLLGLGSLLRPRKPNRAKSTAYESGVDPVGDGWSQSQIRYYVFALLFVIFDVEAVFIFPWATRLEAYQMSPISHAFAIPIVALPIRCTQIRQKSAMPPPAPTT